MSKFGLRKVPGPCENAHEGGERRRNRCTPPIYGPNFHFTEEFAGRVAETSNELGDYGRSTIIETTLPPPRQRVASPRFAPRSFIAYTRVVKTRAPLQPIGWPSANAPPFTLSFSGGMPSSRITARLAAAYASLCSKRSMSSTDMPVFFRSFRTPGIGASITHSGLTPAVLYATTRASGVTAGRSAASLDMTTIAAPPSLNWDAFPAVTCPPSRKTGGSFESFSRDVSIRIPSSTSMRPAPGTSTGTICSLNLPSWVADAARRWLSSAKRSMSSRLILNRSATISPVTPMWNWLYASHRPSWTIASMKGTLLIPIPHRASLTRYGARLIDSMPPARTTSAEHARIMSDANITACSPEPHTLLTVTAPTRSGRPADNAAWRAGFCPRPAEITFPMMTSSMSAGTRPARFTASAIAVLPSLTASTFRKARPYLPTGVREAPARTTSVNAEASAVEERTAALLRCCPMGAEPVHRPTHSVLVECCRIWAARQGPVEGSIEQDRVVEQVRHFVRGTCQTVEQADESKRPATEHPNPRFSPADRRVDKTDEFPWRDGMGAGDVDGAAVSRRRRDEVQHRLGGIVDEDEFVRCVRIQWPSAWLPVDGSLKNRPEDLMHDARTVEVRIPRQDQSHPPVAVGWGGHL